MSSAKKSRGRQKVEMKKMSNESNLQVTFSKRRSGLFKKASELCTLCGADVALIVFSPGEKVFSFGHPNVDAVIDRYLARAPPPNSGTMQFLEAHRMANLSGLNAQLTEMNNQLDEERKRHEELARLKKGAQAQMWWALPIEEMSRAQLEQYKVALEELKKHVPRLADGAMLQSAMKPPQFYPGASSSSNIVHQPHPPSPQALLVSCRWHVSTYPASDIPDMS
ncbi:Agamous-like MADS-box protein AGL62, partial [Mucuna pruriens]